MGPELEQIQYLSDRISTLKWVLREVLKRGGGRIPNSLRERAQAEVDRFDGLRDLILSQEPAPPGLKHDLFDEIVDNIVRGEQ